MAPSRTQLTKILSVLYLVVVIIIAIYSIHLIEQYSIPIPKALGAFTVALPIVAGLLMEGIALLERSEPKRGSGKSSITSSNKLTIVSVLFVVYETVIATLAGTYLGPESGLECGLDKRWQLLFRSKDGATVKRIQNAFECCGLHSVVDKAWPFPDKKHSAHACQETFGRDKSCFVDWMHKEQLAAGLLLLVAVLVFFWKMIFITTRSTKQPWFHRILPFEDPEDSADPGERNARRALEYQPAQNRYSDNPSRAADVEADAIDQGVSNGGNANEPIGHGGNGHSFNIRPSGLRGEENEWRRHTSA